MYKKTLGNNLIYNFLFTGMNYLFPVITVLYISRVLMPEMLGKVSFASTVVSYFSMFAGLGIPIYGMRICAKYRHDRQLLSKTVSELLLFTLTLSAFCYAVLLISVFTVPRFSEDRPLMLIMGCTILLQSIGCDWLYRALEEYRSITVRTFAVKLTALIGMLIFVRNSGDYLIYAVLSVFSYTGVFIINALFLRRYADVSLSFKLNTAQHIKPMLTFFLMSCAVAIYTSLDTVVLGFMKTSYEVGLYSVVGKTKSLLTAIGGVISSVTLPVATRFWADRDKGGFETIAQKAISLVLFFQLPVTVFSLIFADRLMFIIGGDQYLPAVTAFRITVLSVLPRGLSNIMGGQVLISAGYEKKLLGFELAAAVINFVLNILLIPVFSIEGAAFTTLLAEIYVWLAAQRCVRRKTGIVMYNRDSAVKIAAGTLVAGALVFAASRIFSFSGENLISVFLQTAAFSAVYGIAGMSVLLALKEQTALLIVGRITRMVARN